MDAPPTHDGSTQWAAMAPNLSSIYSASTLPEDPEKGLPTLLPIPSVAGLLERRPSLRRLDLGPSNLPHSHTFTIFVVLGLIAKK